MKQDVMEMTAKDRKRLSFQSLVAATNNFDPKNKIGEGGFGSVYKGMLRDGREVAVKKLSSISKQGRTEFEAEAKLLATVQHRNVVSLYGYCSHESQLLLAYEYVPHQSLDKFIFSSDDEEHLPWNQRFEIICGIARGLLYLHDFAHKRIIHRDIKASNVLLDEKWCPRIADFGLARLFPGDRTQIVTRVAGTNGYMAPEYAMRGDLSVKVDVFSFGVLVLEIVSGKQNSTYLPDGDARSLFEWAFQCHENGRIAEMVDPRLAVTTDDENSITTCVHVGLLCTQNNPRSRPDMARVVTLLSKKPRHLEQPARPGVPLGRWRPRESTFTSSVVGTSGTCSSTSNTATNVIYSPTNPRGKQPVVQ